MRKNWRDHGELRKRRKSARTTPEERARRRKSPRRVCGHAAKQRCSDDWPRFVRAIHSTRVHKLIRRGINSGCWPCRVGKESTKNSGALPRKRQRWRNQRLRSETRIPPANGCLPVTIEHLGSDLQQQMCSFRCPLHLLFFDHAFADHILHR
ncbi:hypothetical protein Hgul01_04885 [Herpetosiphon gulosus]|uniref:Uncharacterized protein n=1 Tax=Herpetosiphon gulosus TaxID=1973496 RepID=A0ABP9X6R1_9CHLR